MMKEQSENYPTILLIEDSVADIELIQVALKRAKYPVNLNIATNEAQILSYLFQQDSFQNKPLPHLILLDLNIPSIHGFEILKKIKSTDHLRRIPVVILTTSDNENDVIKSYDLYANCYLKKPFNFDEFIQLFNILEEFWFRIVILPPY